MDFPPVARRVGKLRLSVSVSDRQIDNVNDGLRRRALLRVNTPEVLAKNAEHVRGYAIWKRFQS